MDVIDISSTDSEDDLWDDDDDLEEEIDRLPPNSQPSVNPDNGSNLILHDIGNYALVDNAGTSTEHIYKSSPLKRCTPTQRVSPSTEKAHSGSVLTSSGQRMYYGSNPEQMLDGTVKDMGNGEIEPSTYEKFIPPLKPTVDRENGSGQDAGDSGNCMWKDGVEPSKEHIQRRTLPPSILPIAHPKHGFHLTVNESSNNNSWQGKGNSSKDNIMASRQARFLDGDADAKYGDSTTDSPDCEAKLSMDSTQKRILPSSLQPTILKSVPNASLENNDDIQVLGSRCKLGSFEEAKVTKLTNPKFNIKDNIDWKSDGIQIYENAGTHRQLPSWMSGGSVSRKFGIISSTGSLPSYLLARTGDHSSIDERSMEEDERVIFQAALQDLAQPKYEVDLSAGLLTVPLLRHQRIALAWMQRKETSLHCSGGILADDQGLGKTISVIALIQMERPHQVQFSSSLSNYIRSDALNLEVADHIIPEDKETRHFEENLGVRPQESNRPYDHSGHTASEVLNLVEIDDERHALDGHVREDWRTKAVKSETSGLDKLDLPLPKMKEADYSAESKSSKKAKAKNSVKSTMYKGRPAGGTLIVCPASILRQWSRELDEKVPVDSKLSVLIYHGSARSKDPSFLAQYDVVLTTYAIVTNEVPKQPLSVDDDGEQRNTENFALCSDFSIQKKRKKTSDVHKRGKKKKKGACDSSFDYDSGPLARVRWFRVVLDEAQMIKNYRTQVSRACCGLRAKRRWCLSGTPLQNSLDDLYSYFRFLKYDPYAVYSSFCSSIKNPITRNAKTGYRKLQAVLRTIMLRRTKGTFIDGEPIIKLPPKEICLKKIDFSAEEREFYSNLEADSRQKFKAFAAAGTVNENYASILALLLRLRQACDHPRLVKEYYSSPVASDSLRRAQQLPREMLTHLLNRLEASLAICGICSDQPEDAIVTMCGHVFCYQCVSVYLTGDDNICPAASCKDTLDADSVFSGVTLRNCMSGELVEYSSGGVKHPDPSFHSSSKIEAAMDILKSICIGQCPEAIGEKCDKMVTSLHGSIMTSFEVHADSIAKSSEAKPSELPLELPIKAIVFSQWTSMLDLFQISLNHSLIQYRRLDGTMSLVSRDRAVKDFNSDPEVTVMLMSLKAGNLGLNMIAACHVILLDPWWNPTTEDQAIDRAHRIGQIRPVTVSRLTVSGTVEDRILALQEKKREMVSFAFGEDQTAGRSTRLTAEDLRYLFNV